MKDTEGTQIVVGMIEDKLGRAEPTMECFEVSTVVVLIASSSA